MCCTPGLSSGEVHTQRCSLDQHICGLFVRILLKRPSTFRAAQACPAERLGVQAKHGLNNESAGFDANLQLLAKKMLQMLAHAL